MGNTNAISSLIIVNNAIKKKGDVQTLKCHLGRNEAVMVAF